jgi:hypothetical protein
MAVTHLDRGDREAGGGLRDMPNDVVKALVPTTAAASSLSQEFSLSDLAIDGTLFWVVIHGVTYSDAVARIRAWMSRTHLGPVLVTDDKTAEDLLAEARPQRSLPAVAAQPADRP